MLRTDGTDFPHILLSLRNRSRSGCHCRFAEAFGKARLHRLAGHNRQGESCLAMGAFSAEPAYIPLGFAAAGAVVDDVLMIHRLIAPLLHSFFLRILGFSRYIKGPVGE